MRAATTRFYQNVGEDFIPGAGLYQLATGEYFFSGDEGSRVLGGLASVPYFGFVLKRVGSGIRITAKGLARIERHLGSLGALDDPANQAMLQRLRDGLMTQHDINFYLHELKESALMHGDPTLWNAAHKGALDWQGIPYNAAHPASLYHPDVIREFSEFFNRAAWPQ